MSKYIKAVIVGGCFVSYNLGFLIGCVLHNELTNINTSNTSGDSVDSELALVESNGNYQVYVDKTTMVMYITSLRQPKVYTVMVDANGNPRVYEGSLQKGEQDE